ncbi:hypothetical protein B0T11DRAFT_320367 [Plectosphaerella cucumerina]|uniref:Uncharacterized protein n=1 Tax=Plectosphaerella cucumerina TaxID=40658 RepID=A0A8K0T8K2_9PEZI|nr:hypothetical protein B0T11DRAFT_320367 [Plectosphaerella cucumerina]
MSEERANSNGHECLAQLIADVNESHDVELSSAASDGYLAISYSSFVNFVSQNVAALGVYRVQSFEFFIDLRHQIQSQSAVSIPVLDIITQEIADLREVTRDLGNIGRDMEATTTLKFADLTQAVEKLTATVGERDAKISEYQELIAALDQRLDEYQATSASIKETADRLDQGFKNHEVLIQGVQRDVAHYGARLDHMERHLRGRGWHGSR